MQTTLRAVAVGAASLTLLVGSAGAASAAGLHDANIKNANSTGTMVVCRDAASTTACLSSSPRGTLSPGQTSKGKYGWTDTDMYWIPFGCDEGGYHGPRYVKVSGFYGSTFSARYVC